MDSKPVHEVHSEFFQVNLFYNSRRNPSKTSVGTLIPSGHANKNNSDEPTQTNRLLLGTERVLSYNLI